MVNEQRKSRRRPCQDQRRIVRQDQLGVLDMLVHPVWIFDVEAKKMAWANQSAVSLWNADSLESLMSRSFDDMTESTALRLQSYFKQFEERGSVTDQWTFYPEGEAKTINCTCSGIKLDSIDHHDSTLMLVEGFPLMKEEIDNDSLRGVEMLRDLPIEVCQFDMKGKVMFQNPEALKVYGPPPQEHQDDSDSGGSNARESIESNPSDQASNNAAATKVPQAPEVECHFLSRFVDKKVGEKALAQIRMGKDFSAEVKAHTIRGPRWSEIKLRRTKDPVTAKSVMLYSAKDITEIVKAKKEMEANTKKSEFFAMMAHEIRTPLHQVNGFIDLLSETKLNVEQQSFIKVLKSSSNALLTVINDVLDYSKLEAGKMNLESIPFEPKAVVEGSLEAMRPAIKQKGLTLENQWPHDIPFKSLGDPNRLRQILLNLLQNSVKFTQKGGIKVVAEKVMNDDEKSSSTQSFLKLSVVDTGIGISTEQQKRIFSKYQQADPSVARNYGGTGLGLSICRSLVETMGGTIGVTSEVGVGATFWFTIPLVQVPQEKTTRHEKSRESSSSIRRLASSSSSSSSSTDDTSRLNVLVVEDNKVNQKLVSKMLSRMGHTATVAENGEEAIHRVQQQQQKGACYDAVLMDIQMPVMDGIEATKRLRSLGWKDLPVIGLTASVNQTNYKEIGFTDCISKPVPMQEFKRKLDQLAQAKKKKSSPFANCRKQSLFLLSDEDILGSAGNRGNGHIQLELKSKSPTKRLLLPRSSSNRSLLQRSSSSRSLLPSDMEDPLLPMRANLNL